MADISLIQGDVAEELEEGQFFPCRTGIYEQGDGPGGSQVDDEALPPLLRIQKYAQSENAHDRLKVWRILMDLFRSTPANTMTTYLPLIMNAVSKLADDTDISIRSTFLKKIPDLAIVAMECSPRVPALGNIVSEHLLSMVVKNLRTKDNIVRDAALNALFALIEHGFVSRQDAEIQVCPMVLALSREDWGEYCIGPVTLMTKMVPLLGREVTERVFLDRFSELCTNKAFFMRKICALRFGDFCAVVSKNAYEKILLPSYIGLCNDSGWDIRKACAEVVVSMSCACPPATRRSSLAPVFVKLLQDTNRWVRMSAFRTLGPFILTFADPAVTSLFDNNTGDLVMVTEDGREFRVNSCPKFNRPYYPMGNICKENEVISELFEKDEDNVIMNPLHEICDEDAANDGDVMGIFRSIPKTLDLGKKREDVILQKNLQVVSKAMFGEVILDSSTIGDYDQNLDCDNKENVDVSTVPVKEECEDIKEIVETVKNAVLSFRHPEQLQDIKQSEKNDNQVESVEPNICDNFASGDNCSLSSLTKGCIDLTSTKQDNLKLNSVLKVSSDSEVTINEESNVADCDNLEMFNSYKYWYVSPEMPLDLGIVDDGRSTDKDLSVVNCKTDHLDEQFSFVFDDTIESKDLFSSNSVQSNHLSLSSVAEDDNIVPQLLIENFVSMTDPALAQNTDLEIAYHCAYSLPAVALTLGSKNWHLLKGTVEALASDMQYKVRRTVASSLYELAVILGPEITTDNLTPIFDGFFKDLDEVRIGILKHLANFLRLISSQKRNLYLPRLAEFLQTDNEVNWRFRQELAEQLLLAVPLFRPADAAKHITYIAQILLCDKVAAVRQTALALVAELLRHVSIEHGLTPRLLITLAERFAHSKQWRRRQTFALLCSEMLVTKAIPVELFASDVMPHLLDLSWDLVTNVRLVVARTIAKHIITNQYFTDPNNQHYLTISLRRLQADKDRDVRYTAFVDDFTNPIH